MAAYSAVDIFMRLKGLNTLHWLDTSVSPSVWRATFSRGVTIPAFAGEIITVGKVVAISTNAQNVVLASPAEPGAVVGITRNGVTAIGDEIAVQISGLFELATGLPTKTALYLGVNGTLQTTGFTQIAIVWSDTHILILPPGSGGGSALLSATASEAITAGQVVYLSGSATVSVASCDIPAAVTNVLGFAANTVALGGTVFIRETGLITLGSIPGLSPDDLFLHLNGGLTNDPDTIPVGNFVQRVGLKWSNSQVKIAISESIYNKD